MQCTISAVRVHRRWPRSFKSSGAWSVTGQTGGMPVYASHLVLPPGENTPTRAEGVLALGIGSEAGPTRASDPTRCRCRALAVCGVDSLHGPPPGLPAGISAWSGNGMTGSRGTCVDTRRRVRACLLGRRVPNESSMADGRHGQAWDAFEYEGRSFEPGHGGPARLPSRTRTSGGWPSGVRGLRQLRDFGETSCTGLCVCPGISSYVRVCPDAVTPRMPCSPPEKNLTVREGPRMHRRQCVGGRGSRGRSAACRYVAVR